MVRAAGPGHIRAADGRWAWASRASLVRVGTLVLVAAMAVLLAWQLVPRLILFAETGASFVRWPWTIDRDEAVSLNSASMLSQGRDIYAITPDGFVATPYPPLLSVVGALFLRAGVPDFVVGRLFSLLAALACAWLGGLLVAREAGSRLAGVLAGALFLALSPTIIWAAFYKQDFPAFAFGLAGLVWLARWPAGRRAYGALPWFALAFLTKQTALAAPAAAVLYMLWRDWRAGWRFSLACAAALGVPAVLLDVATRHGYYTHLVTYHTFPWQGPLFRENLRTLVDRHALLLVLACLGLAVLIARRRPSLVALYALTGAGSLIGAGTVGANANHLLEALLPACLAVGVLAAWLGNRWRQPRHAVALALVLLVLALQIPAFGPLGEWYDLGRFPDRTRAERLDRVVAMVAQQPGEVFADDNAILLRAGKSSRYQDIATMGPLAAAGLWDDRQFVADLQARRFTMLVLEEEITQPGYESSSWPPEVVAAVRQHYRLLYRDVFFTYVPMQ